MPKRLMCKICSKLTTNTPEGLVSSLRTLNGFYTLFSCFHCWIWTNKCQLGDCKVIFPGTVKPADFKKNSPLEKNKN